MVCGSIMPGFDSVCNCCGGCGTMCCPVGKERFCDCCNHCFCFGPQCCECCPCGANGCIGYPNHLCGCCGNCNIMWYSGCCAPCALADLYVATYAVQGTNYEAPPAESWSNIVCTIVTIFILASIVQNVGMVVSSSTSVAEIFRGIAGLIELVAYVYICVIFGYSAGQILKHKGLRYEPVDCCNACYNDGCAGCFGNCFKCCSSMQCCCAYCCCFEVHFDQVSRFIEADPEMQKTIMEGRPSECKCCNCWDTAVPIELRTSNKTAE